ncbi:MAG: oligosaccharide flippase family protein, partial [Flavobacterium sp.]
MNILKEKITLLTNSHNRKQLLINFFSLTVFQAIEVLIPIIAIPIIINRVGADKFGLISFALVFTIFFQIIINFGFNTISIRDISIYKNNIEKKNEVFNDTFNSKLILSFLCLIVFVIIIFSYSKFSVEPAIYLFTYLSLFGQSLIPIWFFQGIQETKFLTLSNFIGKSAYLILLLVFLKNESNYLLVPIFSFVGYFITAVMSLYVVFKKHKIQYTFITFKSFKAQLKIGKYMFLSEIKLYFISYFNIFLLGLISGNQAVAYFVGAEKILRAVSNLFIPVQNSLFPVLALKLNSNKDQASVFIKKMLSIFIFFLLTLTFVLFFFSEKIITIALGLEMKESIMVFKILILIPLLSNLDLFFGKQILLNLNKEREFFRVVLFIAIINVPMIYFFITKYSYIGASISQLITQTLLVIGMFY